MNQTFKKAAAVIAAACLAVSTGFFTASALSNADRRNGYTADHLYLQNGANELVSFNNTENFFGDFGYKDTAKPVLPGYSNDTEAIIENKSDTKVKLYLWAADSPDSVYKAYKAANSGIVGNKSVSTLKSESADLMSKITLTVMYSRMVEDDNGNKVLSKAIIYEGNMTGNKDPDSGTTMRETDVENNKAIDLGTFEKGETGTLSISYTVPPELDNTYANKTALVDWVFYAEQVETQILPGEPPSPPSPGTGEAAIPFVIAAAACGLSAIAIVAITFGRRKKEEA